MRAAFIPGADLPYQVDGDQRRRAGGERGGEAANAQAGSEEAAEPRQQQRCCVRGKRAADGQPEKGIWRKRLADEP